MLTEEEMFPEKARHRELVGLLAEIRDRLPSRARPVRLEIHGWPHPPASPETASGASESDAGPSEAAPEAPPAPERPREGDSDEALTALIEPLLPCCSPACERADRIEKGGEQ